MPDTTHKETIDDPHVAPGRGFWVFMALSLAGVGTVAYLQYARVERARSSGHVAGLGQPSELPILGDVPPFSLTERSGKTVTLNDLRGHVWVADFIFTNCAGPCPVMSRRMAALQMELLRDRMESVFCVSFTVDPERDTPAALKEYADTRAADPKRWLFLTGPKKEVRELISTGFKLTVPKTPQEEEALLHSTRYVLVDRKGRIRGYYHVLSEQDDDDIAGAMQRDMPADEKRRLMIDIQALLREGGH